MPKGKPLTNVFVAKIRHSGKSGNAERHSDALGYGLMLQVKPSNTKSWVQYIMVNGRRRLRGLGPYPAVTLKAAREKALLNKRSVLDGGDPFGERRARSSAELARRVVADKAKELSNAKAAARPNPTPRRP